MRVLSLLVFSVVALCSSSASAQAQAVGFIGRAGGALTLLDQINKVVKGTDETKTILEKYLPDWKRDLRVKRVLVEEATAATKSRSLPDGKDDLKKLVAEMEALNEMLNAEKESLVSKRREVQNAVDLCLIKNKAMFDCEDIFKQVELSLYAERVKELSSAVKAKLKAAEAKLAKKK